MKEQTGNKPEGAEAQWQKQCFRKKIKYKKQTHNNYTCDNIFKGVGFQVGKEGLKLYVITMERLGLYTSTQCKNGSDVMKCLKSRKVIKQYRSSQQSYRQ